MAGCERVSHDGAAGEPARGCERLGADVAEHCSGAPDWYDPHCFREGELSLQLLHRRHARAWLEQTRDAATNVMARLPEFSSVQAVSAWIDERWASTCEPIQLSRKQVFTFAISDEGSGFVGAVALHRFGSDAFSSFFVGVDHRGRGLARRALCLLERAVLTRLGIRELFAATYESNQGARRALEAVGWQRMRDHALGSGAPVLFYCRHRDAAGSGNPRASGKRLGALLAAIDSDLASSRGENRNGESAPSSRSPDACR